MKNIGKLVLEERQKQHLTQEELAEKAKVNLRTIQRIENNENEPRGKTLQLVFEALSIEENKIIESESLLEKRIKKILNGLFLILFNLFLISIIGYFTLDSHATENSRIAGFLISFLLPFLIVLKTPKTSGTMRTLKFGFGYLWYAIFVIYGIGVPASFVSCLLPCLVISLAVLYFGNEIMKGFKIKVIA